VTSPEPALPLLDSGLPDARRWKDLWPGLFVLTVALLPLVPIGGLRVPPTLLFVAPVLGMWYLYLRTAGSLGSGLPELQLVLLFLLILLGDITDWVSGTWSVRVNEYLKVFWYFSLFRTTDSNQRVLTRSSANWLQAGFLLVGLIGIAEYYNLFGIKAVFAGLYVAETQQVAFVREAGGESRVTSTFVNPNYYSLFMVLSFWWTYTSPHYRGLAKFLMSALLAMSVLPGQSRTSVAILLVFLLAVTIRELGRWTWLILVPVVAGAAELLREHIETLSYLLSVFRNTDLLWNSLAVRFAVWTDFAQHAVRDPLSFLWGYDHGASGNTYIYDSYYVELVARDGVLFLLLISLPFCRVLWVNQDWWRRGLLFALVVAGITMPFYGNFQFTSIALVMAVMGERRS